MADLFEECDLLIDELLMFSKNILDLGPIITDDRLEALENEIGFELPFDFKYILKKYNGFSLLGTEVYGIDEILKDLSLEKIYHFEHYVAASGMPVEYLAFSPDGRGNHYCIDLTKMEEGYCPIVFWQHDYQYESKEDVEKCNESFVDWVREVMIQWTLEDYNYDGTKK